RVGIENLQEITKFLALCFFAKLLEGQQSGAVAVKIIYKRHRVEAQVGAGNLTVPVAFDFPALDVVDAAGTEGQGRFPGVTAVPHGPDIGGVVGARGGSDARI